MSAVLQLDTIEIRPMGEQDIDQILAIERLSYDFPWSSGIFADCLRVGYCCWVLDTGRDLAGYGIMSVAVEESHILNVCIAPTSRRQGYARALMDHLMMTATAHGASIAYLEVRPSNEAALKLYADMGFRHVGTRRAYYPAHAGREDAHVFSISLLSPVEHAAAS
ncbi:MAG: ribosomal protein S18-alanine N-acetyltransferase [Gammaproteobacteria bacterium]|nr:ribosomal protein S18-alanine N-acetyltransferase [Gammaproteobacteria bacterium]